MEELELHLGSSLAGQLQVRVSYSHSAFPEYTRRERVTGVSGLRSRLETTATVSLRRHDALSPWSLGHEPSQDHLLQLIEGHWGMEKAEELRSSISPRRQLRAAAKLQKPLSRLLVANREEDGSQATSPPLRAHVPVPARKASLQKEVNASASTFGKAVGKKAQKLLTSRPGSAAQEARGGRQAGRALVEAAEAWGTRRLRAGETEIDDEAATAAGRCPFGAEALGHLTPAMTNRAPTRASEEQKKEGRGEMMRTKGKNETGLWNWGSWF